MGVVFDYREHAPPKGEMPDSLLTTLWLAGWCKCLCTSVKGGTLDKFFTFLGGLGRLERLEGSSMSILRCDSYPHVKQ